MEESDISLLSDDGEEDEDDVVDVALPEHACCYCGIHNENCVVKCQETNKWFCNGRGNSTTAHIVQHLVRSKARKISLHQNSLLGDTTLECYFCSNRNIFILGFISSSSAESTVLVCRGACLSSGQLKDLDFDSSCWNPLIKDKAIVDWIVSTPSEREQVRARQITTEQISMLEDLWRTNPAATLADLDKPNEVDDLVPNQIKYEDGYHFQNILGPLIKREADYDKKTKENQKIENITVEWDISLKKKIVARFCFPMDDSNELRVAVGDELHLRLDSIRARQYGRQWDCGGIVIKVIDGTISMEIGSHEYPSSITEGFIVEFVWKSTSFDRMQAALKSFAVDETSVSGYLYHKLLGHDVEPQLLKTNLPSSFSVPGLPELNHSQLSALREVIQRPLSLIQGPPGTGKTVTSASIVYHLAKQEMGQVLVCAPSNVAVDHLAEKIAMSGLRVVRIASKSRESTSSSVDHLMLHNIIRTLKGNPSYNMLHRYFQLLDELGELNHSDEALFMRLKRKAELEILQSAEVICTTCVGAGDPRLRTFRFRQVLIDECTQAFEAESFIPIVMGVKQLILVGDHCQLGPVVLDKSVLKAGLSISLFERLMMLDNRPMRLNVQYRMHPCLSEFPSALFYEGTLQNGVSDHDRTFENIDLHWPVPSKPMYFLLNHGLEEMASSGTSFLNRSEAASIEKIVTSFLKSGIRGDQIGVITPYEGQRAYLVTHMKKNGPLGAALYQDIEVASVDAFQGREKDFIIFSCVRSNELQGIGFLKDPRRLNVALTRARYGLIILGNAKLLGRNLLWNRLLTHFSERGCVFEGSLNNLQPAALSLPKLNIPSNHRKPNFGNFNTHPASADVMLGLEGYHGRAWGSNEPFDIYAVDGRNNNNNNVDAKNGRRRKDIKDDDSSVFSQDSSFRNFSISDRTSGSNETDDDSISVKSQDSFYR